MRIFFHYIADEHNMNFCSADMFEDYMGNNPLPRNNPFPRNNLLPRNNSLTWNNPLPRIYKTKVGYKKRGC